MAFCLFGCGSNTTVQTNNQTTNVAVEVNSHFGSDFLQPIAHTLGEINQGLVDRFAPLATGIQGSLDNANRLASDLRRTANFSPALAVAAPAPSGPSPIYLAAAVLAGVLLVKLTR